MPKFSICLIVKNEEKTLPRLLDSLKEFRERGGEICILDTGSTDDTMRIATDYGCKVEGVGDEFVFTIDKKLSDEINNRFVLDEELVVMPGDKFFNFGAARNRAASMATNDIVSMPDADEVYTALYIDYIDQQIDEGYEQFEFNFVYAHNQFGGEAIKFVQCKMYDRRKLKWTGIIHEMLQGEAKRTFLPEDRFKIEHWQNEQSKRTSYLKGLSYACFSEPNNDRNSHYLARELFWCGRPKSALKEFE
jgi:glycosyltransferase involved in cell wall biosynthesis